jgi:hypothetical protein
MGIWAKIKFYYDTMLGGSGSTLTATSTESSGDYDADYLHNWLETNKWKAEDTGLADPQYITYDAGSGNTASADYLAILGHNLSTAGATVILSNSDDNFATDEDVVIAMRPEADTVQHEEACLIANGNFEVWSNGTNTIPDGWKKNGVGSSISRDAVNFYSGLYSASITRSGAHVFFRFSIPGFAYYQGKDITAGAWVKASVATQVRVAIQDGTGGSAGSFHSGGGDWEFLTVTRTVNGSATALQFDLQIIADGTINVDGAVMVEGTSVASTDPADYIQPLSNAKRYWRLKIAGHASTAPYMTIGVWGDKTELDYASSSYDPYEEEARANVNVSGGGYVTGVHTRYSERQLRLRFSNVDEALYAKVKSWHESHGLKNFFVAWEKTNNPSDIYLMRSGRHFKNPFNQTGFYRDVSIELRGRKE